MTWRNLLVAFALGGCLATVAEAQQPAAEKPAAAPAAADAPKLSEAQRLKAEVLRLRIEVETLKGQLAQATLNALAGPARTLEAEYLETLKAPAGSGWDWSRMQPTPPAPSSSSTPPKPSAP